MARAKPSGVKLHGKRLQSNAYVTCENCEANFRVLKSESVPPHKCWAAEKAAKPALNLAGWFEVTVSATADACHARMMRGDWNGEAEYLWYKRGGLTMAPHWPGGEDDWRLACGEMQRGGKTRDQLRAWIRAIAKSLPCLPEEH